MLGTQRVLENGQKAPRGCVAPAESTPPSKQAASRFQGRVAPEIRKKIWIDIDNSPHVPFFIPIIEKLHERGHEVLLTARNSYQVCELLEFHRLNCKVIGGHWGKNRLLKTLGTLGRAARLVPLAFHERPDLALSLVSRAQILACKSLRIPVVVTFDYEFIAKMQFLQLDWILVPEVVPDSKAGFARKGISHYPGLKEDVYAPRFQPDARLRQELAITESDLLVTVRPPATEAHYHNPASDVLFRASLEFLTGQQDVRVVLLPRNQRQSVSLRRDWAECIAAGRIVIPDHVVDGLNLIWQSDLVISGGGTMNREAAALGVPVYSIFRGKIGAIDRYLAENGRLVLLESAEEIPTKIILRRRGRAHPNFAGNSAALGSISEAILSIAESDCLPVVQQDGTLPAPVETADAFPKP